MYNGLLNRVIEVINQSVNPKPTLSEEWDYEMARFFSPEEFVYKRDQREQREEQARRLVLFATGLAVVGETYHLAKRSGILKKIGNKLF